MIAGRRALSAVAQFADKEHTMSHWFLLANHAADTSTYGEAETTRRVLSSRDADEGVHAVFAEPQMGIPRRDAWSREAERLRVAAAHAGQPLDEEAIQMLDVYDLRALRVELERAGRRHEAPRGLLQRLPVFSVTLLRKLVGAR
jgi:hypothetical protein